MRHILYFCFLILIQGCGERQPDEDRVVIGLSKGIPENVYGYYYEWIRNADPSAKVIDLYGNGIDSSLKILETCDGLLLTGGEDIFPEWYGMEYDSAKCDPPDLYRDSLELSLLGRSMALNIPVMGICRGQQLVNVYFGGTLWFDIPSELNGSVTHRLPDTYDCYHTVQIPEGSLLASLAGSRSGSVNSNHHQGIRSMAAPLKAVAWTQDSLVEAAELRNKESFLLSVQWHPERMQWSNPLSSGIARRFVREAKTYASSKKEVTWMD